MSLAGRNPLVALWILAEGQAGLWGGLVFSRDVLPSVHQATPLKTNMSVENRWLEDVFPTEMVPF